MEWRPEFDSAQKRLHVAVCRDAVWQKAPLTLGYVRERGKSLNRRTGFKVGSVYGLMQ